MTEPSSNRSGRSAELLLLAAVSIWGVNFSVVKFSLRSFLPLAFNSLRFSLATMIMLVVMRLMGESWRLSRRDLVAMILLGIGGHTFYQALFINGVTLTSPSNASLLLAVAPIFVAIYGHVLGTERGRLIVWIGVLLSFLGIVLLVLGRGAGLSFHDGTALGDLLMVGAAAFWAGYTTGSRPLLARYSPIKLTALSMLAGTPFLLLLSVPQLQRQEWSAIPLPAWLGLLFSSTAALALSYVLWARGVQWVGTIRTGIYQNAVPVVATIVAWLTLGDTLAPLQLLGAAVVLTGILLTRYRRPPPAAVGGQPSSV